MQYRRLGRFGLKVSPLCLGTMMFGGETDEQVAQKIVRHAFEEARGASASQFAVTWVLNNALVTGTNRRPVHVRAVGALSRRARVQVYHRGRGTGRLRSKNLDLLV
jgi:aryl-alcohol dehydrogenase-like predicted oxidoreductase